MSCPQCTSTAQPRSKHRSLRSPPGPRPRPRWPCLHCLKSGSHQLAGLVRVVTCTEALHHSITACFRGYPLTSHRIRRSNPAFFPARVNAHQAHVHRGCVMARGHGGNASRLHRGGLRDPKQCLRPRRVAGVGRGRAAGCAVEVHVEKHPDGVADAWAGDWDLGTVRRGLQVGPPLRKVKRQYWKRVCQVGALPVRNIGGCILCRFNMTMSTYCCAYSACLCVQGNPPKRVPCLA